MGRYFTFSIWFLIAWLAFGAWRLRRKGARPGPAAGAMMDQLMDDQRRAAIEIVLEERAAAHDPEDRDGNLPDLAGTPPPIHQMSAPELKALIDSGARFEFVDVRTDEERALASIQGSRLLDQAYHDALLQMDRETPIVFQCHHGVRSQGAAEYFQHEGFRNLHNLVGGINAWSTLVDPSVPRY